jgi:hypothetical protein
MWTARGGSVAEALDLHPLAVDHDVSVHRARLLDLALADRGTDRTGPREHRGRPGRLKLELERPLAVSGATLALAREPERPLGAELDGLDVRRGGLRRRGPRVGGRRQALLVDAAVQDAGVGGDQRERGHRGGLVLAAATSAPATRLQVDTHETEHRALEVAERERRLLPPASELSPRLVRLPQERGQPQTREVVAAALLLLGGAHPRSSG